MDQSVQSITRKYDDLDRVRRRKGSSAEKVPGTEIITPAVEADYTLDQLGNWPGYVEKSAGTTTLNQTRYHNAVNEIDGNGGNSISLQAGGAGSNWADPAHDAAGNMTTMPQPGKEKVTATKFGEDA